MLCRHVVFRPSARKGLFRLISTAAEASKPKPRGRPRKIPNVERAERIAPSAPLELPIRRGPGRPRKTSLVGDASTTVVNVQATRSRKSSRKNGEIGKDDASAITSNDSVKGRAKGKPVKTRAAKRKRSPKQRHHDLASFLKYTAKNNVEKNTSVYRGNHYEYTVVETLKRYGFALRKMGRANDLGIDLLGTWQLPVEPHELRVLIQCKASKPRPAFVRELEGSYAGAPAGWKDGGTMALLVTRDRSTQGVLDALQRSREPMGFAQITELGVMQQFIWNSAAREKRLTGMTVTNTYGSDAGRLVASPFTGGRLPGIISLLWEGKQWPSPEGSLPKMQGPLGNSQSDDRPSA